MLLFFFLFFFSSSNVSDVLNKRVKNTKTRPLNQRSALMTSESNESSKWSNAKHNRTRKIDKEETTVIRAVKENFHVKLNELSRKNSIIKNYQAKSWLQWQNQINTTKEEEEDNNNNGDNTTKNKIVAKHSIYLENKQTKCFKKCYTQNGCKHLCIKKNISARGAIQAASNN